MHYNWQDLKKVTYCGESIETTRYLQELTLYQSEVVCGRIVTNISTNTFTLWNEEKNENANSKIASRYCAYSM